MLTNPPLSLYIHIPWCVKKCPYCDFNSHAIKNHQAETSTGAALEELPEEHYISRLLQDLELELPSVWGRRLHSIFIGGGTPSLFSAAGMNRLLSGVRALIPFEGDIEITMEANPGTFEANKFQGFRDAGINRLSIGVQSFEKNHLDILGRIHNPQQAIAAAEFAHKAGFKSFNLDLMHGLPGQTVKQALTDLETTIALKPQHISWYQLTLEPNTHFYQQPPQLPKDEQLWNIQEAGAKLLAEAGYLQYETSAYSKTIKDRSQHNINYWQFGDYIGIGAGAHGKITRLDLGEIHRTHKKRHPKDYLAKAWSEIRQTKKIATKELPFEYMLNTLRLLQGAPIEHFSQRTGLDLSLIQPIIEQQINNNLLELSEGWLRPSTKGALFLNELLTEFIEIKPQDNQENIPIRIV